ncbi:3-oxoacid CoA-transferase subunit B [Arcobacter sp. F2176]|jgi:acetate CoA/acetoacetate CoA-transferase beta subunit|uniref:3-oxoacid CoA-transferase subunit B n=1 Tax=Arcobacter TaxID=28196 RepID=UPI00100B3FF3|nr:3-oxoacid CoA-transferase subunit B [Arcobacter sp. F2176]RXJ82427.1 succinyl-CoA--3-ketoacid-CoA transferase [Arcobacter sp. F2176]|tara:strand:+ start:616 stop:1257 length:642 start_codon:yes stop_codon:yes gene_type:complete
MEAKEIIAKRVAQEFNNGDFINLGIGLPTQAVNFIPKDIHINLHSENGFAGIWDKANENNIDKNVVDAGGSNVILRDGGIFFDSVTSFEIIRGGHIDITVLGALEVDEEGNLANWKIPGKLLPGMGGAMDLVNGSKKVIISMLHTAKGNPKILKQCTLPLTGKGVVDMIITEMGVFEFINNELVLIELMQGVTLNDIKEVTPASYKIASNLIK